MTRSARRALLKVLDRLDRLDPRSGQKSANARGELRFTGPPAFATVPTVTLLWFVVWLIANNVGGGEPLRIDPVNAWAATLILAAALDFSASHARGRSGE